MMDKCHLQNGAKILVIVIEPLSSTREPRLHRRNPMVNFGALANVEFHLFLLFSHMFAPVYRSPFPTP
jgi:hypothetical protein